MQQPGLDNRHRDKNGTIAGKHGNTLIRPDEIGRACISPTHHAGLLILFVASIQ